MPGVPNRSQELAPRPMASRGVAAFLRVARRSRGTKVLSQVLSRSGEARAGKAGLAGPPIPKEELGGAVVEKDLSIRPLGRARGGGPGLRLGFRNAMCASWLRLSPLFHEGGQILFFPPP
jgi:hypothetical protein